jgi:exonuclease SbcD
VLVVSSLWQTAAVTNHDDGRIGTILHAADLHLGSPLKSLGSRVGSEIADELRTRSTRAFDNLIRIAIEEGVDAVVLAGDVYDNAEYEVAAQLRFVAGLRRLSEAGIRVFIAHGNHDPLLGNLRLAAKLPDNVTVFPIDEPAVHTLSLRSGSEIQVVGVSFSSASEPENLAVRFNGRGTTQTSTIGVLHTNVGSRTDHGSYAPCTANDLANAPVGYWALGHIHLREVNEIAPGRWWAYCGNLQGRSAKTSECGPKGVLLVPVLPDGFGEPEFRDCADVRFERVVVDIASCADIDEVVTAIEDAVDALAADAASVVARVRLTGRADAHRELIRLGSGELLDLVQERTGVSAARVVIKIEIATGVPFDRDQVIARGDVLGTLLGHMDSLTDTPAVLAGILEDLDPKAQKELSGLIERNPELVTEIMGRAEELLVGQLEDMQ